MTRISKTMFSYFKNTDINNLKKRRQMIFFICAKLNHMHTGQIWIYFFHLKKCNQIFQISELNSIFVQAPQQHQNSSHDAEKRTTKNNLKNSQCCLPACLHASSLFPRKKSSSSSKQTNIERSCERIGYAAQICLMRKWNKVPPLTPPPPC